MFKNYLKPKLFFNEINLILYFYFFDFIIQFIIKEIIII